MLHFVKCLKTKILPIICYFCSVATFPKAGNGPGDDPSMQARLKGLIWLATGYWLEPVIGRKVVGSVRRMYFLGG